MYLCNSVTLCVSGVEKNVDAPCPDTNDDDDDDDHDDDDDDYDDDDDDDDDDDEIREC